MALMGFGKVMVKNSVLLGKDDAGAGGKKSTPLE
jgi:hypothetical protein